MTVARRTVRVKLNTTEKQQKLLDKNIQQYLKACNKITNTAWSDEEEIITRKTKLHEQTYDKYEFNFTIFSRKSFSFVNIICIMVQRFRPSDEDDYYKRVDFLATAVLDDFRDEIKHFKEEEGMNHQDAVSEVYGDILNSLANTAYDSDMTSYGDFESLSAVIRYSDYSEHVGMPSHEVSNKMELEEALEKLASKALKKDIRDRVDELLDSM